MNTPRTSAGSVPASYFETKYRDNIDPWGFRTSEYERQKYEATIRALSKPRYQRGLEVGCAIGVLSRLLAVRCETLIAVDGSATAIEEAARQNIQNVTFETAVLPDQFPDGSFDLIVLSEVLYYFAATELARLASKCMRALDAGGEMILCHWLGETDYPLSGYQASELFVDATVNRSLQRTVLHEGIYRLERLATAELPANGAK